MNTAQKAPRTIDHSNFHSLESENKTLKGEVDSLKNEVSYLKEQIAWFNRQVFGQRSEKRVPNPDDPQLYFEGLEEYFQQASEEETQTVASHKRVKCKDKGPDAITLPEDLPTEEIVLDIPDEQKVCKETGKPLVKTGEEVTQKLAHKPGSFYVKKYIRPKYALPKGSEEGVLTAEMPDSLLPKCRVDESFLAEIATRKFADHIPLYRISEALGRVNIGMPRQLLSNWIIKIGKALRPLYERMRSKVLESGNIFADETPIEMMLKGKGKTHQGFMWLVAGGKSADPPYRVYHFRLTRKHKNAKEILKGYEGVLHSDKYGAYEELASRKGIVWCPCWAHIRRKFFEAESGNTEFRTWVLDKIDKLFEIERKAWEGTPEDRLKIRQEVEGPIIDELIVAVKKELYGGKILPKSKYREALGYFCGLIPYLKNYTKHPFARLDNNVAERAIRPLAIGRKNWLFVGNEAGGEAAAIIYSLVQTCRSLKINPREYLEDIFRRLMGHNSQKLEELLPDEWAKAQGLISG